MRSRFWLLEHFLRNVDLKHNFEGKKKKKKKHFVKRDHQPERGIKTTEKRCPLEIISTEKTLSLLSPIVHYF